MRSFTKVFIISILVFPFSASAQNHKDYREYYDSINQAELKAVEFDFHRAYNTYKQAFAAFDKRQFNDLYNASLCAILAGEYPQAKEWISEMITKGAEINMFNTKTYRMLPNTMWAQIKQSYGLLRGIYISRIDTSYKATLDTLRKQEQVYLNSRRSQKSYDSLVYEHAKMLYALISKQGISPVPLFERSPLPFDVLRHHFGLRNRLKLPKENGIDLDSELYSSMNLARYDLEPILRQAVFSGDLSPSFLGVVMDHSELDPTRKLSGFMLYVDLNTKTITHDSISEETLKRIDQYRKSIGLESTRDAARKDVAVALYYNQETFPFDEYIRKYKEIGYTKKTLRSLKYGSAEFDSLSRKAGRFSGDMIRLFYKKGTFKIESKLDDKSITFENKWEILKEFRFSQTIAWKMIIPPYE